MTLLELAVVVALILILSVTVWHYVSAADDKARVLECKVFVESVARQLPGEDIEVSSFDSGWVPNDTPSRDMRSMGPDALKVDRAKFVPDGLVRGSYRVVITGDAALVIGVCNVDGDEDDRIFIDVAKFASTGTEAPYASGFDFGLSGGINELNGILKDRIGGTSRMYEDIAALKNRSKITRTVY